MKPTVINFKFNGGEYRLICRPRVGDYEYQALGGGIGMVSLNVANFDVEFQTKNSLDEQIWMPISGDGCSDRRHPGEGILLGIMSSMVAQLAEGRALNGGDLIVEDPFEVNERTRRERHKEI